MIDNSSHLRYDDHFGNYPIPEISEKSKIVDIGANKGLFTEFASKKYETVHTYEPILRLAELIKSKNLHNVTVFNECVGPAIGKTKIVAHTNRDSGSSATEYAINEVIERKRDWSDLVINECETVDLETVLKRIGGSVDYLKMDCENSEYSILMNKDLSSIRFLGIEIHCQMGIDKWNELKNFVSKTHNNFPDYNGNNIETLLSLK